MNDAAVEVHADDDPKEQKRRSVDAGLYLYSRLVSSLLGLATLGIATRVYGETAEFTFVVTVLLLYETAYALGSLGLPEAVFYFVGHDMARAPIVVRQASYLLLLVALPVVFVVVGTGVFLSKPAVDLIPGLPWLALALLFAMPTQPAINQLLAAKKAGLASVLQTAYAALNAVAILIPMFADISVEATPMFLAGATSVRLVVHLLLMRHTFPLAEGQTWRHRPELVKMIRFAAPAGLAALCGKLNVQIDKYVVYFLLSLVAYNHYTAASHELPMISMIPYAIGAVNQVRYVQLHARGRRQALRELWFENINKASLVVFPVSVFVIVVAPELVELVYGKDYLPAALPFQLFTIVLLHRVASYGAMLQATNQTRALLVSSILLVGTNAILTVPMTLIFGSPGAALATVVANIPPWLWTLSRIANAMGVRLREVMPWATLARGLVVTGVVAALVWVAKTQMPWVAGLRLAVSAIAFLILYVAIARTTQVLSSKDLAFVWRWLSFRLK